MNSVLRPARFYPFIGFRLIAAGALCLAAGVLAADEPAMRTWTDSTGKFKIRAKFLSESGGKVTLEKDDGSEMEIELKKLSTADQKYVKDLGDSDSPFKPSAKDPFKKKTTPGSSKTPAGGKSAKTGGGGAKEPQVITPQWNSARAIQMTPASKEWNVPAPALSGSTPRLSAKSIPLPAKANFFERVKNIVLNPEGTRAAISYAHSEPKPDGQTRIVLCDLEKGRVIGSGATSGQWSVIDMNSDATRVLAKREEFGFGNQDKIEVWSLTSSGIDREVQWAPYDDEKGGDRDVKWGAFLDDDLVITAGAKGKVAVWKYAAAEPQYWLQIQGGSVPTLSPDRKLFIYSTGKDIAAFDLDKEEVVSSFPTAPLTFPVLAFSPDGKRLACGAFDRIYVWDFGTGKLYREVSCIGMTIGSDLLWTDDLNIMIGGPIRWLIDIGLQIPVWDFPGLEGIVRTGETCWLVASEGNTRPGALVPMAIPHAAVKDALNKALMDPDFFVLKSGTTVKINVTGVQDANERNRVLQSLTKKLTGNGCQVGPAGTIELVASTETGESKDITYIGIGTYPFQQTVSRLKFVYQGKTAWEGSASNVPYIIFVGRDEKPSDVLKKHEKPNYAFFDNAQIPKLLTKPSADKNAPRGFGMSRVTATGLR